MKICSIKDNNNKDETKLMIAQLFLHKKMNALKMQKLLETELSRALGEALHLAQLNAGVCRLRLVCSFIPGA